MQQTSQSLLQMAMSPERDEAWLKIQDIYQPLISGWLKRHGINGPDSDDLAQETIIILLKKLSQFEHNGRVGAFRKWLRVIVLNCVRDYLRASKRKHITTENSEAFLKLKNLEDDSSDMTISWDSEHDKMVLQKLLEKVRPQFQPVTWLAFEKTTFENLSPKEVASQLDLPISSVYKAKSRVLSKLRHLASGIIEL